MEVSELSKGLCTFFNNKTKQTIFVKMVEIARKFTDSEKYLKAAQSFRLPYWDYYRPRSYETVFPGVTMGRNKGTGQFVNLEDVRILDRVTGKQITSADVVTKTVRVDEHGRPYDVEILNSTNYPYDFGIPQIFMLEKVMMRLPPTTKVKVDEDPNVKLDHDPKPKLDHNPLRTFWFPINNEIPECHWDSVKLKVSQSELFALVW